jgi:hypothetical protein
MGLFFCYSLHTGLQDYDPDGGVPEGGVPDGPDPSDCIPPGGVPEGRVPFICMPSGGVPEGLVPFIAMPSGGVPPIWPADWLNCGLLPEPASPGVADDARLPASPVVAAAVPWASVGIVDRVLVVSTDELLSVQPATRIPAMRIDDAISIMILFFCIGSISLNVRSMHRICRVPALHVQTCLSLFPWCPAPERSFTAGYCRNLFLMDTPGKFCRSREPFNDLPEGDHPASS